MIRTLYLNTVVFYIAGLVAVLFALSFFIPGLYEVAFFVAGLLLLVLLIDIFLLYGRKNPLNAIREMPDRFSIGDENKITLNIKNNFHFPLRLTIIDEIPTQFQERSWNLKTQVNAGDEAMLDYVLRPVTRGEYQFERINIFALGPLKLARRRFIIQANREVKVYPSFVQMRRYQLLAVTNKLQEAGVKRTRRLGHSLEFEQIREYVIGDDYRTVNWKATARKGDLMVNNFTDERSQQIYCVINKGRVMKMPFNGMSLLDHAINSALVLTNVALVKQDRAGLITFAESLDAFIPAEKKAGQMNEVLETLYMQQTQFLEADYEKLFSVIRNRVTTRGLIVLYTNFESLESLQRELPALKRIARYHLLLVVFFENTELKDLVDRKASTIEDIYTKTIGEKFAFEKRQMVRELQKNGILSILTSPENLTINTVNKYLELKTRTSI